MYISTHVRTALNDEVNSNSNLQAFVVLRLNIYQNLRQYLLKPKSSENQWEIAKYKSFRCTRSWSAKFMQNIVKDFE